MDRDDEDSLHTSGTWTVPPLAPLSSDKVDVTDILQRLPLMSQHSAPSRELEASRGPHDILDTALTRDLDAISLRTRQLIADFERQIAREQNPTRVNLNLKG